MTGVHEFTAERFVNAMALAGGVVTVGVSISTINEYLQAFAYIGSGLAGIGAFIYYVFKRKK